MSAKAVKHHTAEDMLMRIIRVAEILAKGHADYTDSLPHTGQTSNMGPPDTSTDHESGWALKTQP